MNSSPQTIAADPNRSVWVSASAGTGKTKVLTDRVLRLMLQENKWHKIVCLTFTNAAATEMTTRISDTLKHWSSLKHAELVDKLRVLLGKLPTKNEVVVASKLFSQYYQEAHHLKIKTIHSFCKYILRTFSLEANVSPHFEVIDEIKVKSIIGSVKLKMLSANSDSTDQIMQFLGSNFHELSINALLYSIIGDSFKFKELFQRFPNGESYYRYLFQKFALKYNNEETAIADFLRELNQFQPIKLDKCSERDLRFIEQFNWYINLNQGQQIKNFEKIKLLFLTHGNKQRVSLLSKKVTLENDRLTERLYLMQKILVGVVEQINSLIIAQCSKQLFGVAKYLITTYEECKKSNGYLDYDDLIYYTKELLTNNVLKEWVLYKLDGGIDHLLVDEAQDTNKQQWHVIEAIISDFFSGDSASEKNRTIFIVGDDKQSIYSFQGADLEVFSHVNCYIKTMMQTVRKEYQTVNLQWCYRSNLAIVRTVEYVFNSIKQKGLFSGASLQIECFRKDAAGSVELWPLHICKKEKTEYFWPILKPEQESAEIALARDIARYIEKTIASTLLLPSTNCVISAKDFLILVRSRTQFIGTLIKALQNQGLEVAGMDRLNIADNIAILDLLSIAKFVLLPYDELNLAALLKSPLINLTEDELHNLATTREATNLWIYLLGCSNKEVRLRNVCEQLQEFLNLHQRTIVSDFFYTIVDVMGARKNLINNNMEGNDAINEFLLLATNFSHNISTSLQEFVLWFEQNYVEVKRNVDSSNAIRIMTIHGAKGLQSGVVILADTTSLPINQNKFLWTKAEDVLCSGGSTNNAFLSAKNHQEFRCYQEYIRLLYVGMTRAVDKLVICGAVNTENIDENCWYSLVSTCIGDFAKFQKTANDSLVYQVNDFQYAKDFILNKDRKIALPELRYTAKYRLACNDGGSKYHSPLIQNTGLLYGQIAHKILEDVINTKNFDIIETHYLLQKLSSQQAVLLKEKLHNLGVIKQLVNQGYKLQAEVAIASKASDIKVGRIDLLAINNNTVMIIDYKTDMYPPLSVSDVRKEYMLQMQFYYQVMREIYASYKIMCKILWFNELRLMDIY